MFNEPTIEHVLAMATVHHPFKGDHPALYTAETRALFAATEDGPLMDWNEDIVVHRADEALAGFLRTWADVRSGESDPEVSTDVELLCNAADLIDGGES